MADFRGELHPRDRLGRWRTVPGVHAVGRGWTVRNEGNAFYTLVRPDGEDHFGSSSPRDIERVIPSAISPRRGNKPSGLPTGSVRGAVPGRGHRSSEPRSPGRPKGFPFASVVRDAQRQPGYTPPTPVAARRELRGGDWVTLNEDPIYQGRHLRVDYLRDGEASLVDHESGNMVRRPASALTRVRPPTHKSGEQRTLDRINSPEEVARRRGETPRSPGRPHHGSRIAYLESEQRRLQSLARSARTAKAQKGVSATLASVGRALEQERAKTARSPGRPSGESTPTVGAGAEGEFVHPYKVTGTLENRAKDVHAINAAIRDMPEGDVLKLDSGVTITRNSPTGMQAFTLHSAEGKALADFPAGMPMVAAASAIAQHHRGSGVDFGAIKGMALGLPNATRGIPESQRPVGQKATHDAALARARARNEAAAPPRPHRVSPDGMSAQKRDGSRAQVNLTREGWRVSYWDTPRAGAADGYSTVPDAEAGKRALRAWFDGRHARSPGRPGTDALARTIGTRWPDLHRSLTTYPTHSDIELANDALAMLHDGVGLPGLPTREDYTDSLHELDRMHASLPRSPGRPSVPEPAGGISLRIDGSILGPFTTWDQAAHALANTYRQNPHARVEAHGHSFKSAAHSLLDAREQAELVGRTTRILSRTAA